MGPRDWETTVLDDSPRSFKDPVGLPVKIMGLDSVVASVQVSRGTEWSTTPLLGMAWMEHPQIRGHGLPEMPKINDDH